jgi:hypothetical protein
MPAATGLVEESMNKNFSTLVGSVLFGLVFAAAGLILVGSNASARSTLIEEGTVMISPNGLISSALDNLTRNANPTEAQIRSAIDTVRGQMDQIEFRTKEDYWNASQILLRGSTIDDALLAHELSMCALALGDDRARSLAAESWDRVLVREGKQQRFGTQKREKASSLGSPVTDSMRIILDVPLNRGNITAAKTRELGQQVRPIEALN